ncbi:carboxypeptidase-like regulatory domain-containing protein [Kaistella montana]|uniref:Carboxypeptidase-like regulatory domain-containing protein n=1 Tax=Kaistella montana TaxID=1849733 RepID=A0ABW5KAJ3_9FLAO|nr:carboxypeptidase-like regulatory domain-containing protein [Kaistella montana]MCQ4035117.1 hypothetical protein [Kaistella montana]
MKKILVLLTLSIFTINFSQLIVGKIINKAENPIQSARVGIENTEIGDLTDENGNFQIDFSNIDKNANLKVYVSEFILYEIKVNDFIKSNREIILRERAINIEPVSINPKKYKYKNFGTSNAKTNYCGYDSEKKDRLFNEYAIKVENKKHLKVKTINVNIVNFEVNGSATLIFDIQNASNGFPDDKKSLTNETLKLTINKNDIKNNKVSLDISDKNIWTNEDFFVLVRVEESLNGKLYFGGNIFAFSKNTYYRNYFGEWKKYSTGEPSINVDVQIEK